MITARLWFTKTGEASYISLLDLQRVMQRALKRSGLPVWYTQGFNPHIYMTFSAPLALGQESLTESLDFRLTEKVNWTAACDTLNGCLPRGIRAVRVEEAKMDPSQIAAACYELSVSKEYAGKAREAFDAYNEATQVIVVKEGKRGKKKELDLKQYAPVLDYKNKDGGLMVRLTLPAGNTFTVNPAMILTWLSENHGLESYRVQILRTGLQTAEGKAFV